MIPRSVPYERNIPERDNIVTVAMPGITASRAQIARYTGSSGVTILKHPHDCHQMHGMPRLDNRHRGRSVWQILKEAAHTWSTGRVAADVSLSKTEASVCVPHVEQDKLIGETAECIPCEDCMQKMVTPPVLYHVTCRIAPRLLHHVLPLPEMDEMVSEQWYWTLNPLHWILVFKGILACLWFSIRPVYFGYSEAGRTNLAGMRDQYVYLRDVKRAVQHILHDEVHGGKREDAQKESGVNDAPSPHLVSSVKRNSRKHLVLFGCSRGATTCFYAALKLPPSLASYVSLIIVEAPFDTLEHVITSSSWFPRLNYWFFKSFCDYRNRKEEAEAYSYDPDRVYIRCPIAFVVTVKDTRVPMSCTQNLIDGVRRDLVPHKVPAVEVLVLQHSIHPCMSVAVKEDQDAYVAFVERLYDKYCP